MLRVRLATAAVAIPLLVLLIFWAPGWFFAAIIFVIGLLGVCEYADMAFPERGPLRWVVIGMGAAVLLGAVSSPPGPLTILGLVVAIAAGFIWTIFARPDFEKGLRDFSLGSVGVLYVGVFLPHLVWLRELAHGPEWVTTVVAVAMIGDSAGYFVGHGFGRHKLAPRISPGKTLEGAAAILLGSVLAVVLARLILLPSLGWNEVFGLGIGMGVLGQFGDLSKSVMKRTFGKKDSGWIFPGHGGVLDRIDSLLFPACLVYYYLLRLA